MPNFAVMCIPYWSYSKCKNRVRQHIVPCRGFRNILDNVP